MKLKDEMRFALMMVVWMLIGFIVAFFAWLLIVTMTDLDVDLVWFLLVVVVVVAIKWFDDLGNLKPERKLSRFKNAPVEGARELKLTYSGGKSKKIFHSVVKSIVRDGNEEAYDELKDIGTPIVLPNGRIIGSNRLKSVVTKMGQLNDTTRRTWVERHRLARTEWQGILSFCDACEVLERVNGNGTAFLKKSLTEHEDWKEFVNIMVDNWP